MTVAIISGVQALSVVVPLWADVEEIQKQWNVPVVPVVNHRRTRHIFNTVLEHYFELKYLTECPRTVHYSGRAPIRLGHRDVPGTVRPLGEDYVCEVEIAVKTALTRADQALFWVIYVWTDKGFIRRMRFLLGQERFLTWCHFIEEKVGAAFIARGLHPTVRYFDKSDLRGK